MDLKGSALDLDSLDQAATNAVEQFRELESKYEASLARIRELEASVRRLCDGSIAEFEKIEAEKGKHIATADKLRRQLGAMTSKAMTLEEEVAGLRSEDLPPEFMVFARALHAKSLESAKDSTDFYFHLDRAEEEAGGLRRAYSKWGEAYTAESILAETASIAAHAYLSALYFCALGVKDLRVMRSARTTCS